MERQDETDGTSHINDGYERPPTIIKLKPDPASPTADHAHGRPKQEKAFLQRLKKPIPILTIVIALATIGQCQVTKRQLDNMDNQLGVMRDQLKQMREDDKRAERMVSASEGIKASMADAVQNYSTAAKDALAEQRKALAATLNHSRTALDATIATARLEQRAWLTPDGFRLSSELEPGKAFHVNYMIINSGNTPAIREYSQTEMYISPLGNVPQMTAFIRNPKPVSIAIIAPKSTRAETQTLDWTPPVPVVEAYRAKKSRLYLHLRITYFDFSGIEHWITNCLYLDFGGSRFNYCATGNEMDQNK